MCRSSPGFCVGGSAAQQNIAASQRLAVVIPYRDREEHLKKMLPITQQCLQRSNISGAIEEFRRLFDPDKDVACFAWLAPLFVASNKRAMRCFVYDVYDAECHTSY